MRPRPCFPACFQKSSSWIPIILPFNILLGAALARKTGFADRHPLAKAALRKKSEFPSPEDALAHYSGKGMFKTWQPEFVKAFVDWSIEQDTTDTWTLCCDPGVEALMYVLVPLNTWRHAKKIDIPVLVARGQHSEMFQDASGKKLERKIKNARFITIESQGHFFPMEDPDKTIAAIEPFLKKSI